MKLELGHMNIPDAVWERVKKLLPKSNKARGAGGRPRIDDRTVMTAIFYRCKTGIAWRDLPSVFGSKSTLHKRFQEWVNAGIFEKINIEAKKLYEHKLKIRNKRMAADGSSARAPKGGFSPDGIRRIAAKEAFKGIF